VFVAKLAPDGSSLLYSAFLGGKELDEGRGIAVDADGNVYVTGFTESADFPTAAARDASYNGATDGFLAKLDPTGTSLLASTYLGGSGTDRALALALDADGNAHVTGETSSSDFPVTAAPRHEPNGDFDGFVTKFDRAADISYSTLLGGPEFDDGLAIAVGPNEDAYVTGKASTGFPTTSGALDTTQNGGFDAFVAQLTADGSALVYSTYLGGSSWTKGSRSTWTPTGRRTSPETSSRPTFP